jgi:predicted transcriptional regulator
MELNSARFITAPKIHQNVSASLEVIAERVEFLAAIRKGLDQIERGQTIPHDEVKRQLATWLSK